MIFDPASVTATRIKEDTDYEGVRVQFKGKLGSAVLHLQVDIGFGDAVTPAPVTADFPVLLDFPVPHLRVYPRETVVAEKLEAMVQLGIALSDVDARVSSLALPALAPISCCTMHEALPANAANYRVPANRLCLRVASLPSLRRRVWQAAHRLTSDGIGGPPTWAKVPG